jgi:hypothetical protein
MADLIERLRERAESYRAGGPSSEHTASLLDEAAEKIDKLMSAYVDGYDSAKSEYKEYLQKEYDEHEQTKAVLSQEREAREKAQLHMSAWEDSARINKARAEAAEASLAEAKRLLKPFADIGGGLGAAWLDHETHWSSIHDNIAVRDLRAAARFLSQEPNHER